jgi:hypothetical protein
MKRISKQGIYASLFENRTKPLSKELQDEYDKITQNIQNKIDKMTEEQKIAEFYKIMKKD